LRRAAEICRRVFRICISCRISSPGQFRVLTNRAALGLLRSKKNRWRTTCPALTHWGRYLTAWSLLVRPPCLAGRWSRILRAEGGRQDGGLRGAKAWRSGRIGFAGMELGVIRVQPIESRERGWMLVTEASAPDLISDSHQPAGLGPGNVGAVCGLDRCFLAATMSSSPARAS